MTFASASPRAARSLRPRSRISFCASSSAAMARGGPHARGLPCHAKTLPTQGEGTEPSPDFLGLTVNGDGAGQELPERDALHQHPNPLGPREDGGGLWGEWQFVARLDPHQPNKWGHSWLRAFRIEAVGKMVPCGGPTPAIDGRPVRQEVSTSVSVQLRST